MILRQGEAPFRRLTIPNHKEIAKGTLRAIIRQAGLSVSEFQNLLRKFFVSKIFLLRRRSDLIALPHLLRKLSTNDL